MNRSLNQINRMQLVENHLPLIGKFYIIFSIDKKFTKILLPWCLRLSQRGNPTAINRLKCHECEYVGRRKDDLIQHRRTHLGNLSYQCKHCLKKINVKKYKFRCVGCVRGFKNEKEKIRHDKKCLKRRYECHLCKKFASVFRSDLIKHMRKHSGVKPFRCEVCKQCFSQKSNLKYHLNTIHRLKH